jgi:succinoglycan biosynthesis protein ExoA
MTASVSVLVVVRDESPVRLTRLLDLVDASVGVDGLEVVVAGPIAQLDPVRAWRAVGAVGEVVIVDNPSGERSRGLNLGLERCTGAIVCRLDARTLPSSDYIARCAARLQADGAIGVVGGVQRPVAGDDRRLPRGIARALRNPWVLGGAAYRRTGSCGVVDTVYLGAFRRQELVALGGWDTQLLANEDYDLCQRYRARGASVWLEPNLIVDYESRATLPALARQYHAFGQSKTHYWRLRRRRPAARQVVAIASALAAAGSVPWLLRRPPRALGAAAVAVVALAAVDHAADPAEGDAGVRAGSCLASVLLVVSWLTGIARGAARR